MKIERLRWTAFSIPLRGSYTTARGGMASREGLVLELTADGGVAGLGEASPLPAPEGSAAEEAAGLLERVAASLIGRDTAEIEDVLAANLPLGDGATPSTKAAHAAVRAGLDIAACDVLAKSKGASVARLLCPNAREQVEVNALVVESDTERCREAAEEAMNDGFRTLKLKVGMLDSAEAERDRVAAVREVLGPDARLRLDANGAWQPEEAIRTISALEGCDIEFVEQPVAPDDLEGLRRVRWAVRTPIAADECVTSLESAGRVLEAGAADILVLKPMVVGGLRSAREIAELAERHGAEVVVSTSIDSGVGTAAALHLAATLPAGGPACGLATARLLEADLISCPLPVEGGTMVAPCGPGLGIDLDEAQIGRYGAVSREAS